MFDFELKPNELIIPGLYVFLIAVVIWLANGLQNTLLFLARYFNFNYTDQRMKKLDDVWYNIQLFKFRTRINVSTIESVRKIQDKLNSGDLKLSTFKLISGWGDVTVAIPVWRRTLHYISAIALVLFGAFAWYTQYPLVYNYTKVEYGNLKYYISNDKVIMNPINIPPDLSEGRTRKDCLTAMKSGYVPSGSPFEITCNRLLDDSDLAKNRLNGEIEKDSSAKRNLTILAYTYCFLGFFVAFTLTRFIRANKAVMAVIGRNP